MSAALAQSAVNALREHGVRLSPDSPDYGVFGIRSHVSEAKLFFYVANIGLDAEYNWEIKAASPAGQP